MGYTHYWTQIRDFSQAEFVEITAAVKAIVKASGVRIADGMGEGKGPEYKPNAVQLNGWAAKGHDHEPFEISREKAGGSWGFCKTARKPYDTVVTACLTVLANKWGFEVLSDGDVEEWEDGVALAERATKCMYYNPLVPALLVGEG